VKEQAAPLFIPLKREHFDAFESGSKDTEYRANGARWNRRTCTVGRCVTLSCGYGKSRRLQGRIVGIELLPAHLVPQVFREIYPHAVEAICIRIEVTRG
jgi:hypothetical protein